MYYLCKYVHNANTYNWFKNVTVNYIIYLRMNV